MVKLVAMDIDGTLLDSNKNLSEENKKTVKEYEERGIKFTFSTGRIDNELEEVSSKMPYVKYGIMCNGAYVIDFENNKILMERIDVESLKKEVLYIWYSKGYGHGYDVWVAGWWCNLFREKMYRRY